MKTRLAGVFAVVALATVLSAADQRTLTFEAETVSGPSSAWLVNRTSKDHWNLWSTDRDADKKWSGGVVLQTPPVMTDRASPEEGAPPLHTHVTGLPNGRYDVTLKMTRTLGVSRDGGKTWERLSNGDLGEVEIADGTFDLWVDDRFADATNPGPGYYDNIQFAPIGSAPSKPPVTGYATARVRERVKGMMSADDAKK